MIDISDRISFLGIDAEVTATLREIYPTIENALPGILDAFYGHIMARPDIALLFGATPEEARSTIEHARRGQAKHWQRLFSGRFDEDYVASVQKIGLVHNRIGLEPSRYIGGYMILLDHLNTLISRACVSRLNPAAAREKAGRMIGAVSRAVMLDMDIAISTYLDAARDSYDAQLASGFDLSVRNVVDSVARSVSMLNASAQAVTETVALTQKHAGESAQAAELASANTQTVAAATEELAATSGEISRLVERSADVAREAVGQAADVNVAVEELSQVARRIGEVVELIQAVAAQTRLLALNATIEAARAGDAGRGFAVVANEVKSLAAQTEQATTDIATRVAEIQEAASETAGSISGVGRTIGEISAIAGSVAAAVQEQLAATADISRSVQQAADETARIVANMNQVIAAAGRATQSGAEVGAVSERLAGDAGNLAREADAFIAILKRA
ncbi:MAG: protoglobin domain-containing protein [Pseudochelatococcus sp.]|jgi:methyl-accepting chemotaxis protein|uniref:protoglobin domain-containing protein n=1 Tax=Pseudochelatococcus sp. TaxID=2020869 RepID=UPI003D8AF767